ncbi:uncharacterized protein [Nicotiana tomentosiformis]|uniref:uncharacterized protein n=1 Tax=Nicotiana tomentosiformis TaxID=4098 RepID=UPI00388CC9A5
MKSLSINVSLVEDLEQIPGYANFMKDLVTKKRSMNFETIKVTYQVSAIVHSVAPKLEDRGAFMIPCTIGSAKFSITLYDLGASINLMPISVFKTLGIGKSRPTSMRLQMVVRTMKRPLGKDVLVWVDKFILPTEFGILDCEVDYEVHVILGRPFCAMGKALCDIEAGELTFSIGDEQMVFHVLTGVIVDDTSTTINVGDMSEAVLLNFDDDEMDGFMECVNSLQGMGPYNYAPQKLSLDLENRKTLPTNPSIEEPPTLELKPFPPNHWKGSENQVADHLSHLEEEGRQHDGLEINESFPDEQLLAISMKEVPRFADLANFLVSGIITDELSSNQRKKLKRDYQDYYWNDPYLFRICTNGVIRRCVAEEEKGNILGDCYSSPYSGHNGGERTAAKDLSYGFYWPTLYKDTNNLVKICDECQRSGGISKKNENASHNHLGD